MYQAIQENLSKDKMSRFIRKLLTKYQQTLQPILPPSFQLCVSVDQVAKIVTQTVEDLEWVFAVTERDWCSNGDLKLTKVDKADFSITENSFLAVNRFTSFTTAIQTFEWNSHTTIRNQSITFEFGVF